MTIFFLVDAFEHCKNCYFETYKTCYWLEDGVSIFDIKQASITS